MQLAKICRVVGTTAVLTRAGTIAPPKIRLLRKVSSTTLLAMLLSASTFSSAQARTAPSPATEALREWIATFDGSDWDAYLRFVQSEFITPPDPMLRNAAFRRLTSGFDLRKTESETQSRVSAIAQERNSGEMFRFIVEVEPNKPHRILKFESDIIPPAHLSEAELLARSREFIAGQVAADKFSGVVLIAKEGKPIFMQAYGLADRENHIPNSLETRFGTESMGKMFTAVAIFQLVQAGKIALDDPIKKYIADYPNQELASKVTIRELLTHTGGTGDIFGPELDSHSTEMQSHTDYIHLFGQRPASFEPGSRWEYSNYGFVILGVVIERVTGENYYDYVRDHIFLPAGMNATSSRRPGQTVPDLSIDYTNQGGSSWRRNVDLHPVRATAAGGETTTIADLLRFANALQQYKLLNSQNTQELTTGQVSLPYGGKWAYGFQDFVFNGVRCYGHDGAAPAASGDLKICPTAGYVVAVLSNFGSSAATRISHFVLNRLPEPKSTSH